MSKTAREAAIEAVARHFRGVREEAEGNRNTVINVAGRRVALEVAALRRPGSHGERPATPRLRFDRVVQRVLGALRSELEGVIPDGQTVLLTISAPIRLPAKTAAVLSQTIKAGTARRPARVEIIETVHGNRVFIRLVKGLSGRGPAATLASRMIGFVHHAQTDPATLLDLAHSMLKCFVSVERKRAAANPPADRWLVLATADEPSWREAYRNAYAQIGAPAEFEKVLVVFADGRVEVLAGWKNRLDAPNAH